MHHLTSQITDSKHFQQCDTLFLLALLVTHIASNDFRSLSCPTQTCFFSQRPNLCIVVHDLHYLSTEHAGRP